MTRLEGLGTSSSRPSSNASCALLVEKVTVSPNDIEVRLRQIGAEELVLELRPTVPEEEAT